MTGRHRQRVERTLKHVAHRMLTGVGAVALGTAASVAVDGSGAALAQESRALLEEIVITARFREESLQETPLAVTALTGESLNMRNATYLTEIGKFAPNVTINDLGAGWGPTIAANIRGLGNTDFKAVLEPSVVIYIDGVPLIRPTGAQLDLLDLERVEILRGPQGTLFGKNAIGGAIRLISTKPSGSGEGFVEGTTGRYNRIDIRGSFDTEVVDDRLFARVSLSSKQRDGYVDVLDFPCVMDQKGTPELAGSLPRDTSPPGTNRGCKVDEMGEINVQSARVMLRWLPSEDLEVLLIGDVMDQDQSGPADKTLGINTELGLVQAFNVLVAEPNFGVSFDDRFITDSPLTSYSTFENPLTGVEFPNVNNVTHWGLAGIFDWRASDDIDVKLITAYRQFDSFFGRDSDGSPLGINQTVDTFIHKQLSGELQISGQAFGGRTNWTIGSFALHASDFNSTILLFFAPFVPSGLTDRIDDQDSDNYGVFVHTDNQLTDRLSVTLGARWTHDSKNITQIRRFRAQSPMAGQLQFPITSDGLDNDRITPTISLQYDLQENMNTYFTWSRGFRGGGFNPRPGNQDQVRSFLPEDLDSFEVGLKSELFDRRMRFNVAAFHMIYTDLQLPTQEIDPETNAVGFPPKNAGKARMDGIEIDMQATVAPGFLIDATAGWLDFQFKDLGLADPQLVIDAGGVPTGPCLECRPIRTPKWTAALGGQYTFPGEALGGSITLRGDVSYQSKVHFSSQNNESSAQPGYALVDARVTWVSDDESWSVAVFGTNLTDKLYLVSALDFFDLLGTNQGAFGRPREWGLTVKRTF